MMVFNGLDSAYEQGSYFLKNFNLVALLRNPDMLKEVDNPHCSGVLRDVMDGEFFMSHPIFSCHKDALQLFGSTVRSIQLIGIAKTNDIKKYGIDSLLEPFIKDVNTLAKVNGHCFNVNDTRRVFCGDLLLWTGDTLGSNHFLSEEFQERNLTSHRRICSCIEDKDNAKDIRDQLSTTYGVNRLSVLNKVEHFDVCKCFPEDIMHILLEVTLYNPHNLKVNVPLTIKAHSVSIIGVNIVIPKIIKYPIDPILSSMWYHCLNSEDAEDLSTSARLQPSLHEV
ncbi:Hypothetical predicted protein [Paramuricea clavata]|uniref:Uncharacterized protein n=1 Tax=Paramuricea clavata TaxID=317549 RepID=A0A7D9IZ57_PARCT|nr:Hypothetical predicted protein [Paramuricea clavata]